jgi:serine/threonine-protein kinase RsbT
MTQYDTVFTKNQHFTAGKKAGMIEYTSDSESENNNKAVTTYSFDVKGGDFNSAGEASSSIKNILKKIGIAPPIIRKVAIATYEAEMNIVIHAYRGSLTVHISPETIKICAADEGPGIKDIDLAMKEGYSTATDNVRELGFGAGMGLPNIKKCTDELLIDSKPGVGTTVTMFLKH